MPAPSALPMVVLLVGFAMPVETWRQLLGLSRLHNDEVYDCSVDVRLPA